MSIPMILIVLAIFTIVEKRENQTQLPSKAAGGAIDTLSYFKSSHALGDSSDPKNTKVTQIVSGNDIFNVKNNGSVYEYYTYDATAIYLKQDTSVGSYPVEGGTAASYTLSPGTWLKRTMSVGESFFSPATLTWVDKSCRVISSHPTWGFTITLLENKNMNLGGALGNQNVIVVKYDYSGPNYEKFYYAKGWGWVKWEEVNPQTGQVGHSAIFNDANTNFLTLKTVCGTKQPVIKLPSPTPVKKPKVTPTKSPTAVPTVYFTPDPDPTVPVPNQSDACPEEGNPVCYDCNFDKTVNIIDFSCFSNNYGKTL